MRENKYKIQEELNEVAPFLAQLQGQKTGLEAPKEYFNHFEDNLMARIKAEEEAENWASTSSKAQVPQPDSWLVNLKNWLLRTQVRIGFAMVLIVAIASIVWNTEAPSDNELMAVSSIEATEYIQENIDQFSETLLLEAVTSEEGWANIDLSDEVESDFDEYIEDDLIDELDSELINELL